ncbi:MAG: TIGR00266 family protein [Terrimicrobiaceae bacterium]|nr:TIGR00266 family protein [Terrimicrobiaceae bacterium]
MPAHEIDYEVFGHDLQILEVELDPGETVIAEAGAMNYMEDGITFQARMGDGTDAGGGLMSSLMGAAKRAVGGAGVFLTHFTNSGGAGKKRVAFSAPYPGKIVPINLSEMGGRFQCQRDTFLCAAAGTRISIAFTKRFGAGLFGGEGFILQKLEGDGLAFLHAGGALMRKDLNGETLRVDTGCLVGFTDGIEFDIERAGNLQSMVFGGEGLFLATLQGTGSVFLQSLPFNRLADRIAAQIPKR